MQKRRSPARPEAVVVCAWWLLETSGRGQMRKNTKTKISLHFFRAGLPACLLVSPVSRFCSEISLCVGLQLMDKGYGNCLPAELVSYRICM